ncbi:MAG TPA: hypothetical protein VF884_00345 [Nitrososphaeraceae archaeon]
MAYNYFALKMVCKNICERIHTLTKGNGSPGYYLGRKYCSKCAIYLFFEGIFCPYCNSMFRNSPVDKRLRDKRKNKI